MPNPPATPYFKNDDIQVDTSQAPWMAFAEAERGKNIREVMKEDSFVSLLRTQSELQRQMQRADSIAASVSSDSMLLGNGRAGAGHSLMKRTLTDPTPSLIGRIEADRRRADNPEIVKYFENLKSDPVYDKKGRSYDLAPTNERNGAGHVTAWCAAFVNWCLAQANTPRMGYGTAASWLTFGTPLSQPVYGCLTIVRPSTSTGSTTGHIAFYAGMVGKNLSLLGGNQGDKVSLSSFKPETVLGYRWPTSFNIYELARPKSAGALA